MKAIAAHVHGDSAEQVRAALGAVLGGVELRSDLGAATTREERLGAIRRAHFGNALPWLAQIVLRAPDGDLVQHWALVEGLDEVVRVMDPNPWNDIDENEAMAIGDFLVLWDLTGCANVRA